MVEDAGVLSLRTHPCKVVSAAVLPHLPKKSTSPMLAWRYRYQLERNEAEALALVRAAGLHRMCAP